MAKAKESFDGDEYMSRNKTLKRRKKNRKFRIFLLGLAAIFAAILILGGIMVGAFYSQMNYIEIEALTDEPLKEDGVINILLIGNDSRNNDESGRSDAMMLLSISRKTKTIHITSLLRDIYVEIPGYGGNPHEPCRRRGADWLCQ